MPLIIDPARAFLVLISRVLTMLRLFALLLLPACVFAAQPARRPAPPPDAPGYTAHRDLVYASPNRHPQALDVFVPENTDKPLPLIVWIHGGGWRNGSKNQNFALRWARPGYVFASINYRLTDVAPFPAQIEDCKAAIRWLRAHAAEFNIDPARIGVWGSSAGGHLASLLGTTANVSQFDTGDNLDQSAAVQAVVDFYGPIDLIALAATPGYERHARADSAESKLLGGGTGLERAELARLANPITHLGADTPPFLIVHGTKDAVVPPAQSELFADALQKAGIPVSLHLIEGAKHGGPEYRADDVSGWVEAFFAEHLQTN
jgi:acetyl esterase/lipase